MVTNSKYPEICVCVAMTMWCCSTEVKGQGWQGLVDGQASCQWRLVMAEARDDEKRERRDQCQGGFQINYLNGSALANTCTVPTVDLLLKSFLLTWNAKTGFQDTGW